MHYSLIPPEAYANMPQKDPEKFTYLVNIAQGEMASRLTVDPEYNHVSEQYVDELRSQFIDIVNGLAEEFGVNTLPKRSNGNTEQEYRRLSGPLAAALIRIQARAGVTVEPKDGVQLSYKTKAWLRQEITQMMGYVQEADLPKWKQDSLLEKLRQLLAEVDAKRFSYAAVMTALVPLAALCGGASTATVNAPKIIQGVHHVIERIGSAYAEEEAENLRLSGPPLAISDQSSGDKAS